MIYEKPRQFNDQFNVPGDSITKWVEQIRDTETNRKLDRILALLEQRNARAGMLGISAATSATEVPPVPELEQLQKEVAILELRLRKKKLESELKKEAQ
jgi:hypothetical protein